MTMNTAGKPRGWIKTPEGKKALAEYERKQRGWWATLWSRLTRKI